MAYRILSALFFAALVAAAPAYADSVATYERQCSRDKWSKVYRASGITTTPTRLKSRKPSEN